jgi:hypothetical protein
MGTEDVMLQTAGVAGQRRELGKGANNETRERASILACLQRTLVYMYSNIVIKVSSHVDNYGSSSLLAPRGVEDGVDGLAQPQPIQHQHSLQIGLCHCAITSITPLCPCTTDQRLQCCTLQISPHYAICITIILCPPGSVLRGCALSPI